MYGIESWLYSGSVFVVNFIVALPLVNTKTFSLYIRVNQKVSRISDKGWSILMCTFFPGGGGFSLYPVYYCATGKGEFEKSLPYRRVHF